MEITAENEMGFLGANGIPYERAIASEPTMMPTRYSLCLLKVKEGENVAENRLRASQRTRSSDLSSGTATAESIQSESDSSSINQNNTENKVAGFNTDTLATQSGSTGNVSNTDSSKGSSALTNEVTSNSSGSETDAGNELNKGDVSRDKTRQLHAHGNIGVTTVAEMMAGELETYPKINIVAYITQAFKERFCLLVY